jgi:hypothetical protein
MLKVIVSKPGLAFAAPIASLNEPDPASLVVVTVNGAPELRVVVAARRNRAMHVFMERIGVAR